MRVLRKNSLTQTGTLIRPSGLKIVLNERSSTISPTVIGETAPTVGTWVLSEEGPAAGMVFRVRSTEDSRSGAGQYSFTGEHIINTLKDTLLVGEVTPKMMGGSATCTAKQAFQYILKKQSVWQLGYFAYSSVSKPYSFNNVNLLAALETVTGSLEDAYWDLDTSSYPFTLNVRRFSDEVDSEMRMSRNITGPVKITIDKSNMYTVIYPVGKNNLKIGSLQKNVSVWGRIEHSETDQSMDTADKLRDWAQERLDNHCEPTVTVQVPGLYLVESTGEALDRIRVNRICRVPLPKNGGTEIVERVTEITWQDWVKEPEVMTVKLCNSQQDVQSIIKQMVSSSSKKASADAKAAEEDHAWFEDTTEHVAMVAEAIIGRSPSGVDWRRIASIIVDGSGIHQRVEKHEGDIVTLGTDIEQNEEAIRLEARQRIDGENELRSSISVTAAAIRSEVVGKNGVISAINQTAEEILIQARRINLEGYVKATDITADFLSARIAQIPTLRGISANFSGNVVAGSSVIGAGLYIGTSSPYRSVGGELDDLKTGIRNVRITSSGNTYTLQKQLYSSSDWVNVGNFSRAVSSFTRSGGSGKVRVTANPQGQHDDVPVSISGPNSITSNGNKTYLVMYEDSDGDDHETGAQLQVNVNVPSRVSSWTWTGSGGAVRVTAQPMDQTKAVRVSVSGSNNITRNGTYVYKAMYEDSGGDDQETGAQLSVDVNVPDAHTHSMSITRVLAGRTAGGVDSYYGRLYYYDNSTKTYVQCYSADQYWYRSSTNRSGTNTYYY